MKEHLDKVLEYIFVTCASLYVWLYGGVSAFMKVFIVLMIFDFITGIMSAIIRAQPMKKYYPSSKAISSYKCTQGIFKKIMYLILIGMCNLVGNMFNINIAIIIISFLIFSECVSILENMGQCGVKLPPFIVNTFEKLRDQYSGENITKKDE